MKAQKGTADTDEITLVKTGIAGLDEVLHGGLTGGALYLVEGTAGTGKTTLGLQFALEGVQQGEAVLYVTLSESKSDLERVARSHGWNLEKVHLMQPLPSQARPTTMFHPSEVELDELMTRLKGQVEQVAPTRIVLDSLAEIRLMAEGPLRFRREIMGLRRLLIPCRCTILLLEEIPTEGSLRTFADGVMFLFDERPETALARAAGLHMDVQPLLDDGRLRLRQVDPAELSAGHLAYVIRREVETHKVCLVVIDSLNGYLQAMPDQQFLLAQMHEMLTYLGRQGVATFLVMGQRGVIGDTHALASASYLTDNVILLRFFEASGEVHKAISVVKKRSGSHATTIHELKLGPEGITVGEALRQFRGISNGAPIFTGTAGVLIQAQDDESRRVTDG